MTEVSQGPDWWLASDGKWYPPQQQAPPAPPPPQSIDRPPAPDWWLATDGHWYPPHMAVAPPGMQAATLNGRQQRTAVSSGLTGTLQGFFWAAAAVSAVTSILGLVGLAVFREYWDAPAGSAAEARAIDDVESVDSLISAIGGWGGIASLVIFVLMVIWSYQAHQTTQSLWTGRRSWSSGWTIGGWFIPVANAIIPKLVLNEVERIALAPRTNGSVQADWSSRPTSAIGWMWWIGFVIGTALSTVGFGMFDDPTGTQSSWQTGYVLVFVGFGITAASAVFGALYVRKIGRALSAGTAATAQSGWAAA